MTILCISLNVYHVGVSKRIADINEVYILRQVKFTVRWAVKFIVTIMWRRDCIEPVLQSIIQFAPRLLVIRP
jgi:hypothetical protein